MESLLEDQVRDAAYWRALNPELAIGALDAAGWDREPGAEEEAIAGAAASYGRRGFFELRQILPVAQTTRMRRCIEALRARGWHPIWSFVYDDFWTLGRSRLLRRLLPRLLGGPYALLPHVFAHYVEPAPGQSGWLPHIDAGEDGVPSASLWIALSPATLDNGCMYLVPRDEAISGIVAAANERGSFTSGELASILRSVRALPAEPGDLLCWDEGTLHWGASYESGAEPRISVALEFTPMTDDPALIDPLGPLPSLDTRLRVIARAILTYARFDPRVEAVCDLARRLAAR